MHARTRAYYHDGLVSRKHTLGLDARTHTRRVNNQSMPFERCRTHGCTKQIFHFGPHTLDEVNGRRHVFVGQVNRKSRGQAQNKKSIGQTKKSIVGILLGSEASLCDLYRDKYNSFGKRNHRFEFANACTDATDSTPPITSHILYTESSDGAATRELLRVGFSEKILHPCNLDSNVTAKLRGMFPAAVVEDGDIHDIFKKRDDWLGVWFDLEESWHNKNQEWRLDMIPDFKRAKVVAVSLSSRGIQGGAEALAKDLDHLLYDKGGWLKELCRAYDGKSGCMNMVFGLAFFKEPLITPKTLFNEIYLKELSIPVYDFSDISTVTWPDRHKYKVVNGCYRAMVTNLKGGKFHISYMSTDNTYFFRKEEVSFENVKKWWGGIPARPSH